MPSSRPSFQTPNPLSLTALPSNIINSRISRSQTTTKLKVNDQVWVDLSTPTVFLPPWPCTVESISSDKTTAVPLCRMRFCDGTFDDNVNLTRFVKFVGWKIDATEGDDSLCCGGGKFRGIFEYDYPPSSSSSSTSSSVKQSPTNVDFFSRNITYTSPTWSASHADFHGWQADVLLSTFHYLRCRGVTDDEIEKCDRIRDFSKKLKLLEQVVLRVEKADVVEVIANGAVAGATVDGDSVKGKRKRNSTSTKKDKSKSAKIDGSYSQSSSSSTSTSNPDPPPQDDIVVDAKPPPPDDDDDDDDVIVIDVNPPHMILKTRPPLPPKPSKSATPWECDNCLATNSKEVYYCAFCECEQVRDIVVVDLIGCSSGGASSSAVTDDKGNSNEDAIDLISSDEESEDEVVMLPKVKKEYTACGFGEADQPPDVIEVLAPPAEVEAVPIDEPSAFSFSSSSSSSSSSLSKATASNSTQDDDEIHMISTTLSAQPLHSTIAHSRADCKHHKFAKGTDSWQPPYESVNTVTESQENSAFCSKCVCFVCDLAPDKCKDWFKPGTEGLFSSHCNAHPSKASFKKARELFINPFNAVLRGSLPETERDVLLPTQVLQSLTDQADLERALERMRENYEVGARDVMRNPDTYINRTYRMLGGFGYDSEDEEDDECVIGDIYNHKYENINTKVAKELKGLEESYEVSKYSIFSSTLARTGGGGRTMLVKCAMTLASLTKNFYQYGSHELPDFLQASKDHKVVDGAEKQYNDLVDRIDDLWGKIIFDGRCDDDDEALRKAIVTSLKVAQHLAVKEDLSMLVTLAENGWGSGSGSAEHAALNRLYNNTATDEDRPILKGIIAKEPKFAQNFRLQCLTTRNPNDCEQSVDMYISFSDNDELKARNLLRSKSPDAIDKVALLILKLTSFDSKLAIDIAAEASKALILKKGLLTFDDSAVQVISLILHLFRVSNEVLKGTEVAKSMVNEILKIIAVINSSQISDIDSGDRSEGARTKPSESIVNTRHLALYLINQKPSALIAPEFEIKTGIDILSSILGILCCVNRTIVNPNGCGNPHCNSPACGAMTITAFDAVNAVYSTSELVKMKDFVSIGTMVAAVESSVGCNSKVVDKFASTVINEVWNFTPKPSSLPPSSFGFTDSMKSLSVSTFPASALRRWTGGNAPKRGELVYKATYKIAAKAFEEDDALLGFNATLALISASAVETSYSMRAELRAFSENCVTYCLSGTAFATVSNLPAAELGDFDVAECIFSFANVAPAQRGPLYKILKAVTSASGDWVKVHCPEILTQLNSGGSSFATRLSTLVNLEMWKELETHLLSFDLSVMKLIYKPDTTRYSSSESNSMENVKGVLKYLQELPVNTKISEELCAILLSFSGKLLATYRADAVSKKQRFGDYSQDLTKGLFFTFFGAIAARFGPSRTAAKDLAPLLEKYIATEESLIKSGVGQKHKPFNKFKNYRGFLSPISYKALRLCCLAISQNYYNKHKDRLLEWVGHYLSQCFNMSPNFDRAHVLALMDWSELVSVLMEDDSLDSLASIFKSWITDTNIIDAKTEFGLVYVGTQCNESFSFFAKHTVIATALLQQVQIENAFKIIRTCIETIADSIAGIVTAAVAVGYTRSQPPNVVSFQLRDFTLSQEKKIAPIFSSTGMLGQLIDVVYPILKNAFNIEAFLLAATAAAPQPGVARVTRDSMIARVRYLSKIIPDFVMDLKLGPVESSILTLTPSAGVNRNILIAAELMSCAAFERTLDLTSVGYTYIASTSLRFVTVGACKPFGSSPQDEIVSSAYVAILLNSKARFPLINLTATSLGDVYSGSGSESSEEYEIWRTKAAARLSDFTTSKASETTADKGKSPSRLNLNLLLKAVSGLLKVEEAVATLSTLSIRDCSLFEISSSISSLEASSTAQQNVKQFVFDILSEAAVAANDQVDSVVSAADMLDSLIVFLHNNLILNNASTYQDVTFISLLNKHLFDDDEKNSDMVKSLIKLLKHLDADEGKRKARSSSMTIALKQLRFLVSPDLDLLFELQSVDDFTIKENVDRFLIECKKIGIHAPLALQNFFRTKDFDGAAALAYTLLLDTPSCKLLGSILSGLKSEISDYADILSSDNSFLMSFAKHGVFSLLGGECDMQSIAPWRAIDNWMGGFFAYSSAGERTATADVGMSAIENSSFSVELDRIRWYLVRIADEAVAKAEKSKASLGTMKKNAAILKFSLFQSIEGFRELKKRVKGDASIDCDKVAEDMISLTPVQFEGAMKRLEILVEINSGKKEEEGEEMGVSQLWPKIVGLNRMDVVSILDLLLSHCDALVAAVKTSVDLSTIILQKCLVELFQPSTRLIEAKVPGNCVSGFDYGASSAKLFDAMPFVFTKADCGFRKALDSVFTRSAFVSTRSKVRIVKEPWGKHWMDFAIAEMRKGESWEKALKIMTPVAETVLGADCNVVGEAEDLCAISIKIQSETGSRHSLGPVDHEVSSAVIRSFYSSDIFILTSIVNRAPISEANRANQLIKTSFQQTEPFFQKGCAASPNHVATWSKVVRMMGRFGEIDRAAKFDDADIVRIFTSICNNQSSYVLSEVFSSMVENQIGFRALHPSSIKKFLVCAFYALTEIFLNCTLSTGKKAEAIRHFETLNKFTMEGKEFVVELDKHLVFLKRKPAYVKFVKASAFYMTTNSRASRASI